MAGIRRYGRGPRPASSDRLRPARRAAEAPVVRRVARLAARLGPVVADVARTVGTGLARTAVTLIPPAGRGALPRVVTDYKAPNYWLDYGFGFVRRGLPGEVLRRICGGPPTYRQMETAAVGLTRAAALSVVPMAVTAGRRATGTLPRAVATALLVLSPLTASLLLHDLGRYDGVGVVVLAMLALGRGIWPRLPLPATALLLAGAVSVAAASEEFLVAVLAPSVLRVVALVARQRMLSPGRTALLRAGVLGPGALVAAASLLVAAPREALAVARGQATRAGVAPAGPMGDTLTALDRGFTENLAFFQLFGPTAFVAALLLWSGLYAATTGVLGRLLGEGGPYRRVVSAHAVVGAALSVAGVDFRRWWGLGLLGVTSSVVLLDPPAPGEPVTPLALAGAAALALAGLPARDLNVHPLGRLRVERALPATI